MASLIDGHAKTLDHVAINKQPTTDMRREGRVRDAPQGPWYRQLPDRWTRWELRRRGLADRVTRGGVPVRAPGSNW